jgi:GAF domain-containing protein
MERSRSRILLYFFLTLILAYAVDLVPFYVSWFSGGRLVLRGTIQQHRESCHVPGTDNVTCTDSFRIPHNQLNPVGVKNPAIGLGIMISGTQVYCADNPAIKLTYGDIESGSRALELLRTYQIVDLSALKCSGDLVVNVWGPKSYRRSGYIGGPLVFGDLNLVNQVRRTIEFFTTEVYLGIFGGLLACVLIARFLLGQSVKTARDRNEFEDFTGAWAVFGFMKSGVPEILLPIVSSSLIYVRLSNFVSSTAHLGPALLALSRYTYSPAWVKYISRKLVSLENEKFKRAGLYLVLGLIAVSPYFAKWLGIMTIITACLSLAKRPKDWNSKFCLFAIAASIETAKLFNFRYTPYGSTTLLFVSFLLFERFLAHIRMGSRVISTLNWSRSMTVPSDANEVAAILKSFAERFGIRQISLIEPKTGGSASVIIQFKDKNTRAWSSTSLYLEKIPPVFSHVLTTRDSLWNVHQESDFAIQLRKGSEARLPEFDGPYFTVLPVLKENVPVAAVGITSYDDVLVNDTSRRSELETALNVIFPLIAECLWTNSVSQSDEWYRRCVRVSEKVLKIAEQSVSSADLKDIMQRAAETICEETGFSIFISRVNPITREYDLKVTHGFSEEVAGLYANTGFYALQGNTQGPMPLAINRAKVVTVADLTWLFSVLHPLSLRILKLSECRSAAAVPVFSENKNGSDFERVWGLIWFESRTPGTFLPTHETGLRTIAAALESVLSQRRLSRRAHDALKGLVREDVAKKLLEQKPVREVDQGYLVAADIRGSTQIANEMGVAAWNSFVDWLKPKIAKLAGQHGLQLEMIVWDAFFLTRSANLPNSTATLDLIEFSRRFNKIVEIGYRIKFPNRSVSPDGITARVCVEHGDTTRDIQNGNWSVVGIAMAHVCKLESVCKPLQGWFFVPERLQIYHEPFAPAEALHPATKERVVVLKSSINVGLTSTVLQELESLFIDDQKEELQRAA